YLLFCIIYIRLHTRSKRDCSSDVSSSDLQTSIHDGGGSNRPPKTYTTGQLIGLMVGPVLFVVTLLTFKPEGLSGEGIAILASTLWIAVWWMTEAVPIQVTSLLPLVLFPLTDEIGSAHV